MPDMNGLATTTVLNTKLSEAENIIPNASGSMTTTVFNPKISKVENKSYNHYYS